MDITFTVKKEVLEKTVSKIITVCERPSEGPNSLPYFFHIRIDGYGTALKLSAGNAVRNIEVLIGEVSEHTPFCFGVYGRYFHNILKALPDGDLTFTLRDVCYMHNGSSTLKFQILGAGQFPSERSLVEHEWWEVDYRELFSRLKKIVYAVDTKGFINKNYIKGVNISADYLLCTDNKRMSIMPNGIIPLEHRVIVSAESINAFASVFNSESTKGFVFIDGNTMSFSQGHIHAVTRLMEYDAPVFESVIPKGPCTKCELSRQPFMMAIKRAIIVSQKGAAKEETKPVTLEFSSNKIKLFLENQGFGISENLDVEYLGPDLAVNIDLILLYQAVKNIEGDRLRIEIRGDKVPFIVTDVAGSHLNIIMPVFLRK